MSDFSYNDIPTEIQNILMDLAQTDEDVMLRIGKIVLTLLNTLEEHEAGVPVMKVYKACAVYLKRSAATVRTCVYIARYLPQEIYDEYNDVLSISQFKALIPHAKGSPDQFREVIHKWFEYCDQANQKPMSVDGLRAWLSAGESGRNFSKARWNKTYRALERIESDPEIPDALRRAVGVSIREINRQIDIWGLTDWRV